MADEHAATQQLPQALLREEHGRAVLWLGGRWLRSSEVRPAAAAFLRANPPKADVTWHVVADGVSAWDTTLLVFLSEVLTATTAVGAPADLTELPDGLARLLRLAEEGRRNPALSDEGHSSEGSGAEEGNLLHASGRLGLAWRDRLLEVALFVGELTLALWRLITFRSKMRWCDFRQQLVACGPSALPIISLISFLMGLILAYVGSIPLKWFQAQSYVASLVGIGMLRLEAPVMVGIVMAGRTGAAYAAELGTMRVNEELDAFETMGVSKMDFLILPRFLAMALMLPVLAVFADIVSILGGMLVAVFEMDLTANGYLHTLVTTTRVNDLLIGLVTCFVLGILDACCGCYQGLHCGRSAEAVGHATTAAVVNSLVCVVVATSVITVISVVLKL